MKATQEEVAAAAGASSELEVSSDNQMVRRKHPLPPPSSLQRKNKPQALSLNLLSGEDADTVFPLPSPNTQHAIMRLLEYYFGDENFLLDRNLQQLAVDEPNQQARANGVVPQGLHWKSPSHDRAVYGGWVPLSELVKLQRLQLLRASLADVRAAVQYSAQTVMLSEDGLFVRRRNPLPPSPPVITYEGLKTGLFLPTDNLPSFTVMEYNILADHLTREEWFPYTTDDVRDWNIRSRIIRKQIRYHQPDLLCLEEVQSSVPPNCQQVPMTMSSGAATSDPGSEQNHVAWFCDWLQKDGYQVHYVRKALPDGQLREGVDIGNILAWKVHLFELLEVKDIILSREILAALQRYADRCSQFMDVERLQHFVKHSASQLTCGYLQVAGMVRLRHRATGRQLVFCGVHITANYRAPYTQVMQVQSCLEALELFSTTQRNRYSPAQNTPVVLCGDFNSTPEHGSIMLLANGMLKPGHAELEMAVQRSIMLPYPQPRHNLQFLSSHHWAAHKSGGMICGFPIAHKGTSATARPSGDRSYHKATWPWQHQEFPKPASAAKPVARATPVSSEVDPPTAAIASLSIQEGSREADGAERRVSRELMSLSLSSSSQSERSNSASSGSPYSEQDPDEAAFEEQHRGFACAESPRSPGIPQLPLTNYTHEFSGTLDYIWFTPHRGLQAVAALGGLSTSVLAEYTGLPSQRFPSDHLPVVCRLSFC